MIAERILSFDQARKEFIKFVMISVGSDFKELDSFFSSRFSEEQKHQAIDLHIKNNKSHP